MAGGGVVAGPPWVPIERSAPLKAPQRMPAAQSKSDRRWVQDLEQVDTHGAALREIGFDAEIARRGVPAPVRIGKRWVVERTNRGHPADNPQTQVTPIAGRSQLLRLRLKGAQCDSGCG